jgi:formylglycine-generating enzyme required for sulfatase activity
MTWNDIGKTRNDAIRIKNEAAQRKNEAENAAWRESLQSAQAELRAMKERESDLGREIRNSSSLKKLVGILRYQESDQHKLEYLRDTIRELEEKIATSERRKPVAFVPEQVQVLQQTPSFQTGNGVYLFREINIAIIPVKGGTFTMGSENEKPVHQVTLSDFCIGRYQVTQEQYRAVIGSNPSSFAAGSDAQQRPVEQVSWHDAVAFCNKLSDMEGFGKVYTINGSSVTADITQNGYRLPTEAEWEYAARGGKQAKGYTYSGSNDIGQVAWYDGNSGKTTHAVGTKAANELGLNDMSGNVWEWCNDWYGNYGSGAQSDPMGASSGGYRVDRGGGWSSSADSCRSANRNYGDPVHRYIIVGFRVARRPWSSGSGSSPVK